MAAPALPIFESATNAYRTVGGLIGYLPIAAALPFLLSLLLSLPVVMAPENQAMAMVVGLLEVGPYTLFAVAWYRLVMLGPEVARPSLALVWSRRHWRFLSYTMMFALAGAITVVMVLALADPTRSAPGMGQVVALALLLTLGYMLVRLCLVLPAAALDEDYRLQHSWTHTSAQGLRLLAILAITMLPVVFATLLIGSALSVAPQAAEGGTPSAGRFLMTQFTVAALGYFGTALSITVIAQAFRTLAGWYPGDQHKV